MFDNSFLQTLKNKTFLVTIPRIAVFIFIGLQITGMLLYPGGTIHDDSTVGYSFTRNFFSDLGTYAAYNNEPNFLSMALFIISLTLVGTTFMLYYLALPQLFKEDPLNYKLSILGTIFAIG